MRPCPADLLFTVCGAPRERKEPAMDIGLPETEREIEIAPLEEPLPDPAPIAEPVEEPAPA